MGVYIELINPGPNKLNIIQLICDVTKKNLKEAKEMLDSAPVVITSCLNLNEAEKIKMRFEDLGATIRLR